MALQYYDYLLKYLSSSRWTLVIIFVREAYILPPPSSYSIFVQLGNCFSLHKKKLRRSCESRVKTKSRFFEFIRYKCTFRKCAEKSWNWEVSS